MRLPSGPLLPKGRSGLLGWGLVSPRPHYNLGERFLSASRVTYTDSHLPSPRSGWATATHPGRVLVPELGRWGSAGRVPVTDQLLADMPPGVGPPRNWLSFVTFLVARLITRMRRPRPTVLGNLPRDFPTRGTSCLLLKSSPPPLSPAPQPLGPRRSRRAQGRGPLRRAPRSPARTRAVSCLMRPLQPTAFPISGCDQKTRS